MSDDPIERLRAHLEKHKHHQQAFFSTASLTVLLTMLTELRVQNERLIAKEAERISKALVIGEPYTGSPEALIGCNVDPASKERRG